MSESVHKALPAGEELRTALLRLEEVLGRHGAQMPPPEDEQDADEAGQLLRRCVVLMQQEAERLRILLALPG